MVDLTGVSRILDMLRSNTSREVELRSERFWRMFDIKRRTEKTIQNVRDMLISEGIQVTPLSSKPFGKEDDKAFLKFKLFSIFYPNDKWFDNLIDKNYDSETEVLIFFVYPLLMALGYLEDDFSFHRVIRLATEKGRGRTRDRMARKIPDLVLYHGQSRTKNNALVVVETKMLSDDLVGKEKRLNQAIGDVRYYWTTLHPKLGVATDGDRLIVFDPREQPRSETYSVVNRSQLKENWTELYMLLSKQALIE